MDDTPLAFLHQPANGVPVLGFRGDPDDRLLMEAVLPLLQVGQGTDGVCNTSTAQQLLVVSYSSTSARTIYYSTSAGTILDIAVRTAYSC